MMRTPRDTERSAANVVGAAAKTNGTWWLMLASIAGVVAGGLWAGCILKTNPLFCEDQQHCKNEFGGTWECDLDIKTCYDPMASVDASIIDAPPPQPDASPCSPGGNECAENAPMTPICEPEGRVCVECVEDSHCNIVEPRPEGTHCFTEESDSTRQNTCGCVTHEDCRLVSGICDGSSCVPEDEVIYVDNTAGIGMDLDDCGKGGTMATQPCASIAKGVERADADNLDWVLVRSGSGPYAEPLVLADVQVHIVGEAETAISHLLATSPGIRVTGGATDVTLDNLTVRAIQGNANSGVLCEGGKVRLIDVTVESGLGVGVSASAPCDITIARSLINGNDRGGVTINGAQLTMISNIIQENGGSQSSIGGVSFSGKASGKFSFNTVVLNNIGIARAGGVLCDQLGTIETKNNLVQENEESDLEEVEGACEWSDSVVEQGILPQPNCAVSSTMRLASTAALCIDQGDSDFLADQDPDVATLLRLDIDGDERPQRAAPDIGADEFK